MPPREKAATDPTPVEDHGRLGGKRQGLSTVGRVHDPGVVHEPNVPMAAPT
jgi:hypothetical protein